MNKRAPAATLAVRRQAGAQFEFVPATFNVRGLSLPDQTRIVGCGAILIGCTYLFIARW
jgi:hypothetical protein